MVVQNYNPSKQETENGRHEFWVSLGDIVRPRLTKQNSPQNKKAKQNKQTKQPKDISRALA